jgi:gliding motility-associated protein GldE
VEVASNLAFFVLLLRAAYYPFASLLTHSTAFVDKYVLRRKPMLSSEDLSHALELTSTGIPTLQRRLLKDLLKLGEKDVREIMQPRIDIVAFEDKMKFTDMLKKATEYGFSRIPVYSKSLDEIKGMLYVKDLLKHIGKDDGFYWLNLLRPAYFVPESKKINDLIEDFRKRKIHLAIVVDEFGSTSGIVTLEDVVEEILGEINDEFDEEKVVFSKLGENEYVFEGKVSLMDFARTINVEESLFQANKGGSDTLAGFILELYGRIPEKNEKINFQHLTFTIEAADKRTIQRVKVNIGNPAVEQ